MGTELSVALTSRRYRDKEGGLGYVWRPWLAGATVLLLSAELDPLLVSYRLGRNIHALFEHRYTQHVGTEVYNLSDSRFSAAYLSHHMSSFALPFAQLIARERESGRQVLVVTRKRFVGLVAALINGRLRTLVNARLRLVRHADYTGGQEQVPVISYGVQGINDFEQFKTAICVGSYNVSPKALDRLINDTHLPDEVVQTEVAYMAGKRRARIKGASDAKALGDIAQRFLFQVEFNTANQAVGRIRHCTRPRTVIFCQQTEIPYELSADFNRFEGFRQHFGLETARAHATRTHAQKIQSLRKEGLTQQEVAEATGLSLRTIKRKWHSC